MTKPSSFSKILLVVAGGPDEKHAGELFLRDIVGSLPSDQLVRYSLITSPQLPSADRRLWERFESILDLHPAQSLRLFKHKLFKPLLQIGLHLYQYVFLIPVLAKRITQVSREKGIDMIWIVLSSPQLIYLADKLVRTGSIPLISSVWDPPERFINDQKIPPVIQRMIMKSFKIAIAKSLALGTASEGMRDEFHKRYNKESVVLIHSIDERSHRIPRGEPTSPSQLVIGFSGNLYSSTEWLALLDALNTIDWTVANRKIIVRVLGFPPVFYSIETKMNIEYLGWRTISETIDILASCDIAYLPYWIAENYRYVTRMCFPNKLSVYLASGIPVFYHGAPDASPDIFMKKYKIGIQCYSHDRDDIINTLSNFANDPDHYTIMSEGIKKARQEELNLNVFRSRFLRFIMFENSGNLER